MNFLIVLEAAPLSFLVSLVWVIIGRMIAGLVFIDGWGPVQREAGYGGGGLCGEADVGVILMPLQPLEWPSSAPAYIHETLDQDFCVWNTSVTWP